MRIHNVTKNQWEGRRKAASALPTGRVKKLAAVLALLFLVHYYSTANSPALTVIYSPCETQ
jgi:hypothetical protein